MARFSEQFVQQVAQATDIVEIISQYVALNKRGKEFLGLCPFHDDHRPSLHVSPAKQIFKCFACGAGGGVFQFLVLYEKLSFPEVVRTLAERAGIPVPQDAASRQAEEGPTKAELAKLLTFAARYFRSQLHGEAGAAALEYARKRALTDESIQRFGLGYAPEAWDALIQAARGNGYSDSQLVAAGLAVRREGGQGCYDRFRNRLMFPIIDPAGTVIAFGGRAMGESEGAKYINSPDSILFDKSSQLYALNWAREAIVSSGQAIVVEGYLDALMLIQHGLENVVATLGTSLTDRHARLLLRYAREVVVVFDADLAGAAAAERALEMFLAQQFHVRVATVPAGKDPCDFCLAEGPEAFRKLVSEAPDALQHVWQRRQEAYRAAGGSLADRRQVIEDFLRLVVSSAAYGAIDAVRRGQLAQHIGHMLNVSPEDLQQQMQRLARRIPRSSGASQPQAAGVDAEPGALTERQVLEVLLNCPDLFDCAAEQVDAADFSDERLRRIAECVWRLGGAGRLNLEELLALECICQDSALVAELATAGERRGNYRQTLVAAVAHMAYRRCRQEIQELKSRCLDDEALRELTERLQSPDVRRRPGIA